MFSRNTRVLAATLVSVIALCGIAISVEDSIQLSDEVPNMLGPQFYALGARMTEEGKEKTVYQGTITDALGNSSPARVTIQSPGLVKLEGFKGAGSVMAFDGNQTTGVSNRVDESILEAFLMDMPESLLAAAGRTAAVRLLDRDYSPDPRIAPGYTGPHLDMYDATMPVVYKEAHALKLKKFSFDAETHLLVMTVYSDNSVTPSAGVKTRFSDWVTIEGSQYPAKIDHSENGALIFSFVATTIEGGPAVDASNFR
jgi:hypothetical protein